MDYYPLWFPVVVGLALLAIVSILRAPSLSGLLAPLSRSFREHPFRWLRRIHEKIFLLWMVGVGAIYLVLAFWLIQFRLKMDFFEWLTSFFIL